MRLIGYPFRIREEWSLEQVTGTAGKCVLVACALLSLAHSVNQLHINSVSLSKTHPLTLSIWYPFVCHLTGNTWSVHNLLCSDITYVLFPLPGLKHGHCCLGSHSLEPPVPVCTAALRFGDSSPRAAPPGKVPVPCSDLPGWLQKGKYCAPRWSELLRVEGPFCT